MVKAKDYLLLLAGFSAVIAGCAPPSSVSSRRNPNIAPTPILSPTELLIREFGMLVDSQDNPMPNRTFPLPQLPPASVRDRVAASQIVIRWNTGIISGATHICDDEGKGTGELILSAHQTRVPIDNIARRDGTSLMPPNTKLSISILPAQDTAMINLKTALGEPCIGISDDSLYVGQPLYMSPQINGMLASIDAMKKYDIGAHIVQLQLPKIEYGVSSRPPNTELPYTLAGASGSGLTNNNGALVAVQTNAYETKSKAMEDYALFRGYDRQTIQTAGIAARITKATAQKLRQQMRRTP